MQSLPKPRINPWLASYVDQHQGKQTRYEIDKYLIEAGYNPAEIELAWTIRDENNYSLSKPKFKWKFGKLTNPGLGPVMLLVAVLLILFSFVFFPGLVVRDFGGEIPRQVAILLMILPPIGSVAGAITGYAWALSDNKRYVLMIVAGLLFTLAASLVIGVLPHPSRYDIGIAGIFIVLYFPTAAMWLVFLLFEFSGLLIKVEE